MAKKYTFILEGAIEHLGVKSGVAVSERNHSGTTPESQTFIGGKGWVIDLITKSQFFPKGVKWYFVDDSDDHLLSVQTMNPECSQVVKCVDIDPIFEVEKIGGLPNSFLFGTRCKQFLSF